MATLTTTDGTELYYKDWGEGRPVVMIHGWPLSADSWDDLAIPVAEAGYRVIAYDRRGFGRSGQPFSGYDYDTLADDLNVLLQATGVTSDAALIGFSMGGGEVARYFRRHGESGVVSRAILVSSVVPYLPKTDDNPDGVPPATFDQMTAAMKTDRAAFLADFFKKFYGVGMLSHPVSDAWLEWSRAVGMQSSLKAMLACAQAFATTDFRPDLRAVDVPTLVIHGSEDQTVPLACSGQAAARGIASAELKVYDGAPHGLFATHKDQLREDVLRFLHQT